MPSGDGNAGDVLEIIDKRDVAPRRQKRGKSGLLAVADLESKQAVWLEGDLGLGDESAVDVQACFACEECGGGLVVAYLGVEGVALRLGDVGRIADDGVEGLSFAIECR